MKKAKQIFLIHSKREKEYLKELQQNINEFDDDYFGSSYDEFVDKFDPLKEVFIGYIEN
jgi:hypothetical protein